MTINKSDCCFGHNMENYKHAPCSVPKWGPDYRINHTLCQHVYSVHVVHCSVKFLIQELQKLDGAFSGIYAMYNECIIMQLGYANQIMISVGT